MKKEDVISYFNLKKSQINYIEFFFSKLLRHNRHINLVGKSTLLNFWDRHVADCLQLSSYILNRKSKILDLGTGAGLPGVLLSIIGYNNVLMVDSVSKKTEFVKDCINELSLSAKIKNKRIEEMLIPPQDIIVSRALAPLNKLLTYALVHSKKNTTSLFLKGRNVNNEIEMAKKNFFFNVKIFKSISKGGGCVLEIKNIKKKNND